MKNINICNVEDLEKLRNLESDIYYIYLNANISFDDYNSYKDLKNYYNHLKLKTIQNENYKGFDPIILNDVVIVFEGHKHEIRGLYINRENENNVGLFDCKNNSAVIVNNLQVMDAIIIGKENVGILGGNINGSIKKCYLSGTVNAVKNAGMVCGASNDRIDLSDNSTYGTVISSENAGAICGKSRILITDNFNFCGAIKNSFENQIETTMCPDYFMYCQTKEKNKIYTL